MTYILTGLGIFVVTFCVWVLLFGIFYAIGCGSSSGKDGILAFISVAIIFSITLAAFICDPEHYGYQKIDTVSGNIVEVQERTKQMKDKKKNVYIVTYWENENFIPIFTVFDNEEAAKNMFKYCHALHKKVILDKTVVYSSFTNTMSEE